MTRAAARPAIRRRSPVVSSAAIVAVLAAAALLLSGCVPLEPAPHATPTGLAKPLTVAPSDPLVVPAVLAYCPLESAVHDDAYALPVDRVYICRADGRHDTDGVSTYGPWESAALVVHPEALLAAYRVPDARATPGVCPNRALDPLIIWVFRDGVTNAYYAPVDRCGLPTQAAADAYHAAKLEVLVDVDRGAPSSHSTTATCPSCVSQKDANG